MNEPVAGNAPSQLIVLVLLFVALELAVGALDEVIGTGGLVSQARDLQDAITSYWRSEANSGRASVTHVVIGASLMSLDHITGHDRNTLIWRAR